MKWNKGPNYNVRLGGHEHDDCRWKNENKKVWIEFIAIPKRFIRGTIMELSETERKKEIIRSLIELPPENWISAFRMNQMLMFMAPMMRTLSQRFSSLLPFFIFLWLYDLIAGSFEKLSEITLKHIFFLIFFLEDRSDVVTAWKLFCFCCFDNFHLTETRILWRFYLSLKLPPSTSHVKCLFQFLHKTSQPIIHFH